MWAVSHWRSCSIMETLLWLFGWLGTIGLFIFYWLIGSGKVVQAYVAGIIGGFFWLLIGVGTMYGIHPTLPSLVLMESVIIIMNIRGIIKWRRDYAVTRRVEKR